MRKNLFQTFFIGCIAIIHSCEYEPNEIFLRETIKNPPAPTIQSVNLDLNSDTIYIYSTNIFMYDFSSNKEIKAVKFILDNTEQYIGNTTCNSFDFKNGALTNGIHTLVAQVYVGSGTKSIADIVGSEGYVMTKTWVLKVDKNYYAQTYASSPNGYLKITWPKYLAPDFIDYKIYRLIFYYPAHFIEEQSTTEFIDSTYVGEGGHYLITVNRKDKGELDWGEVIMPNEIPVAKVIVKDFNQYFFTWNKSKYYNAVDTFKVINEYGGGAIVKSIQNPNDTSYSLSSELFGTSVYYVLQVVPKKGNIYFSPTTIGNYFSHNEWTYLGYPLKSASSGNIYPIKQVSNDEFVYIKDEDTLIRYSTTLQKIVEKKSIKLCGGSYIINTWTSQLKKYISTFHYCNNTLLLINPKDFNESTTFDISNVSPLLDDPIVSDNKIMAANTHSNSFIYDLNNKMILGTYTISKSGYLSYFKSISSNGNYLFLQDDSFRLIKFINPNFQKIWTKPYGTYNPPKYYEFHALNPEQLAYWDGQIFYIKQCSDFSTIYEFALTDLSILNIDYYHNKILCYNTGHLLIRSLLNGDLLQDIPINIRPDNFDIDACSLINNVIVCQRGVMYFLN